MSKCEETLGRTKNTQVGLHILCGLGMPQNPIERAGGHGYMYGVHTEHKNTYQPLRKNIYILQVITDSVFYFTAH